MRGKNEEEVEHRNQQADEAWKEYQRIGQSVSHEAMMEWFDTWGTYHEKRQELRPKNTLKNPPGPLR